MFTLAISCFDHFQFTLFHGPNIPGSYATLFFTALDFISIIGHVHIWALFFFGSISSFFLELFLYWSPVAYWAPSDLGHSSFKVLSFCLFILFMGFSGEGNGTPLQYSCLEYPMDGGAWWAAIYRVSQSRTRLKWLSSSSMGFSRQRY